MNIVNHPAHYNKGASQSARKALAALGISEFEDECIEVLEQHHADIINDGHLMTAVIYLWRCEYKGQNKKDLEKAQWWLSRALGYRIYSSERAQRISGCMSEVSTLIKKYA